MGSGAPSTVTAVQSAGISAPYREAERALWRAPRPPEPPSPIKSAGDTAKQPLIRHAFVLTFAVPILQPCKAACRIPNKHRTRDATNHPPKRDARDEGPRHEAPCNAPLTDRARRRTARRPRPRRRLRRPRGRSRRTALDRTRNHRTVRARHLPLSVPLNAGTRRLHHPALAPPPPLPFPLRSCR